MLEEVGEAAVAGLDLVARAGADDGQVGDRPRAVVGNDHQPQAVGQRLLMDLVREDLVGGGGRSGDQGQTERRRGQEDASRHDRGTSLLRVRARLLPRCACAGRAGRGATRRCRF